MTNYEKHEIYYNHFFVPTISRDEVEKLALTIAAWHKELEPASDTQVVFRDPAFVDDVAKTNISAILEQNGIKHVRSL